MINGLEFRTLIAVVPAVLPGITVSLETENGFNNALDTNSVDNWSVYG
jgi:hypothetical protein